MSRGPASNNKYSYNHLNAKGPSEAIDVHDITVKKSRLRIFLSYFGAAVFLTATFYLVALKESLAGDSLPAGDESRGRSVSPREEKESLAGDSSPAGDESRWRFVSSHEEKESPADDSSPAGDGRHGELHVKVID
ncbi:hypothetical protein GW17_00015756 [Ensete ventricosum]|nr:hypothetical protein GW17_00015756 [Ensete ventricosum]